MKKWWACSRDEEEVSDGTTDVDVDDARRNPHGDPFLFCRDSLSDFLWEVSIKNCLPGDECMRDSELDVGVLVCLMDERASD